MGPIVRGVVALGVITVGWTAALPVQAEMFRPEITQLANGLTVMVATNRRAPQVTHMVWYKVGSADDPAGKTGLAHYLEHLMFKGSGATPPGGFSRAIARVGGRENAYTSLDYTAYFQTIAIEQLPLAMGLEAERMAGILAPVEEAVPERDVVRQERRQRTDGQPGAQLSEQTAATLFSGHPYGVPIIGWDADIAGLTREDALAFHQRWYAPNNAILALAGDITLEQAVALAERHYGAIPARPVPPRVLPAPPPQVASSRLEMTSKQVREASWQRRYRAPSLGWAPEGAASPRHRLALQMLAELLDGNGTGRMARRLLEGSTAKLTSLSVSYDGQRRGPGVFLLAATPAPGGDLAEIERLIDAELSQALAEGFGADEVRRAGQRLADAAAFALDSAGGAAHRLGAVLALGQPVSVLEDWPAEIASVTPDEVLAAARLVLQGKPAVTSILRPEAKS